MFLSSLQFIGGLCKFLGLFTKFEKTSQGYFMYYEPYDFDTVYQIFLYGY